MKKLLFGFLAVVFMAGCIPGDDVVKARAFAKEAQIRYQRAQAHYREAIRRHPDSQDARFELGKLFYAHGDYSQAIGELKKCNGAQAEKFLALSYYASGDFTDALEVFSRGQSQADGEYLYYYGLTCEKLNLFDKAIEIYRSIKDPRFRASAAVRINTIEKQATMRCISEVSPDICETLRQAPDAALYPQAGALILRCDERMEVTASNTQVSDFHYLIKILNERGKENFSEIPVEYDSTYEKVELQFARTIKPDGTVVDVGSRHMRDVSKYLNFPLYSNARVFIISFPEITEGASIEYAVKIRRNELINKKDFVESYPVQASEPILSADFSITLPSDRTLYIKKLNARYNTFSAELDAKDTRGPASQTFTWSFKNIPQIIPESNMPPTAEINPTMLFSTFGRWEDVYVWWWALAKDKIKADQGIKDMVKALTADIVSKEDKAKAVYNFCAQKIRYVAVEYGQAGYEPHKAQDIFKNKYGDCKDQAILLVTMLREIGVAAWPVLIPTRELYNLNEEFPSMLFNHCIAALELEGELIFLDPTAETCSFGDLPSADQGRRVLVCKESGYQIAETPLFPPSHNPLIHSLKMQITPQENFSAQKSVLTDGIYQQMQRYWFLYTPPELVRQQLEERIQEVAIGAKLGTYTIKNLDTLNKPLQLQYSFSGSEYFTAAGPLRIVPQLPALDPSMVAKDTRAYPLYMAFLDAKEMNFEIALPAGLRIAYLPDDVAEDNRWFALSVGYRFKNRTLYFTQKTTWKSAYVGQEQYVEFKKIYEALSQKIKQKIVLKKGK